MGRIGRQALSLAPWLCISAAGTQPDDCALEGPGPTPACLGESRGWPGRGGVRAGLRLAGRMPGLGREQLEGWSRGGLGWIVGVKAQPWQGSVGTACPSIGPGNRRGGAKGGHNWAG